MEKNAKIGTFSYKERNIMQRSERSFLKNGKERKERNVLLQKTKKNARTFRSFAKERENDPFFFQYIYIDIYRYI